MMKRPFRITIERQHLIFPPEQRNRSPVSNALWEQNLYYTAQIPYTPGDMMRIIAHMREPDTLSLAGDYEMSDRAADFCHQYLNGETMPEAVMVLTPSGRIRICDIVPRK